MSLTGKFVFYMNREFHQCGEIIDQIGDAYALVKWDNLSGDPDPNDKCAVLIDIKSMVHKITSADGPDWQFFPTREALEDFHHWLGEPMDDAEPASTETEQPSKLN